MKLLVGYLYLKETRLLNLERYLENLNCSAISMMVLHFMLIDLLLALWHAETRLQLC